MSMKAPARGAWVNENLESTRVDKIWYYLDQLFGPNPDPNGMFLYDWGDPLGKDNGAHLFSEVTQTKGYQRLSQWEKNLYKTHAHILKDILDENTRNIIDMGCGDGEKSAQVLDAALGEQLAWKTYIPADISPYFVDHAGDNVKDHFSKQNTNIKTVGMNIDFLTSDAFKDIKHKIYLLLGWSIGNFSDEEIVQILQNMADNSYKETSKAAFSYFTAPDKESETYQDDIYKILAAYGDPDTTNPYFDQETHQKTSERILRWFESLGIERNSIEFCVKYDKEKKRIVSGVKVKKRIVIKRNGKNYLKEPGEHIWAIQSRRFSKEDISALISQAWGEVIDNSPLQEGMAAISFEVGKTPEAIESNRKLRKNKLVTTITTLALLAALGWGMKIGEKRAQEKERKERIERASPYVNLTQSYRWLSNDLTNKGDQNAEQLREHYEITYAERFKTAYNIDDAKAKEMKRSFLSWYVKQTANTRYSLDTRGGYGESYIHLMHDFINERGEEFWLSQKDYFGNIDVYMSLTRNTLHSELSGELPQGTKITNEKIISHNHHFNLFDEEGRTIGKVAQAEINGQKMLVAAYVEGQDQYSSYSVDAGKEFLKIYYMNYPWLYDFSKQLAAKYQFKEDNSMTHEANWREYNRASQEFIQKHIAWLLMQGYEFDFYTLGLHSNEYQINYFASTFLPYSKEDYENIDMGNRDWFESYNVQWLLDECIEYVKKNIMSKEDTLSLKRENRLRSIIFTAIYNNMTLGVRTLTAEKAVADLEEEIKAWLVNQIVSEKTIAAGRGNGQTIKIYEE